MYSKESLPIGLGILATEGGEEVRSALMALFERGGNGGLL
jgi:hypothetical protein